MHTTIHLHDVVSIEVKETFSTPNGHFRSIVITDSKGDKADIGVFSWQGIESLIPTLSEEVRHLDKDGTEVKP